MLDIIIKEDQGYFLPGSVERRADSKMDVMGSEQSNCRDWIQAMESNADSYAC